MLLVCLVPRLSLCTYCKQLTENWVGPGNEATIPVLVDCVRVHGHAWFVLRYNIWRSGCQTDVNHEVGQMIVLMIE